MADAPESLDQTQSGQELPPGSSPCPYLPQRIATYEGFETSSLDPAVYLHLMNHGCRRSGRVVYRMACQECQECIPIRVPIADFCPNRSQRRCWQKNSDLRVEVGRPRLTAEKRDLYLRYVTQRHHRQAAEEAMSLEQTLYATCVPSVEMAYRDASGTLLAIGICDRCPGSLSSVYCYFDPQQSRRGLGTYASLWEIDFARHSGLSYYYLGYLVRGCRAMSYKSLLRPYELLQEGRWRRFQQ